MCLAAKPLIWSEAEGDLVVIKTSIDLALTKKQFAFEKQQGLYHNKVNLSLTPVQRLGNQAHNCKMDYCIPSAFPRPLKKNSHKTEEKDRK